MTETWLETALRVKSFEPEPPPPVPAVAPVPLKETETELTPVPLTAKVAVSAVVSTCAGVKLMVYWQLLWAASVPEHVVDATLNAPAGLIAAVRPETAVVLELLYTVTVWVAVVFTVCEPNVRVRLEGEVT